MGGKSSIEGICLHDLIFSIADIPRAVMRCVTELDMVGRAIAVLPNGVLKTVEFPEFDFLPKSAAVISLNSDSEINKEEESK